MSKRVAAYLRVSTSEQIHDNQRPGVEALCRDRGHTIVKWYEETVSGAAKRRPVFEQMLADARSRKFDALVVWSVDRFTRGGAGSCFAALGQIDAAGVDFISVKENYLDTSGPFRDVLLAFAATVARMERDRLIERTKAGLARARAQGRVGGRPRKHLPLVEAALNMLDDGASYDDVRKRYGVPASTLRRYRAALRESARHTIEAT
jgi:DNA invertase Pin-like site-specific DNA recombinase